MTKLKEHSREICKAPPLFHKMTFCSMKLSNKNVFFLQMTRFPIFCRLTKSSFWLFAVWVGTSIKVEICWLGPEDTKTSGKFWFQFSFSVISYFPRYSVSFEINTTLRPEFKPNSNENLWCLEWLKTHSKFWKLTQIFGEQFQGREVVVTSKIADNLEMKQLMSQS